MAKRLDCFVRIFGCNVNFPGFRHETFRISEWQSLWKRRYSQYPPVYQNPMVRKDELEKPLDENDPRKFMPIRAALNNQCPHVLSDPLVSKLVNILMIGGKKEVSRQIVLDAFERIKRTQVKAYWTASTDEERSSIVCDPFIIFHAALKNITPILWLMPVFRGGIIYQVPIPISDQKGRFRAMQFIRSAVRDRDRQLADRRLSAAEKLSTDLLDAFNNTGILIKKKQDLYRVCEANKTYASYRATR